MSENENNALHVVYEKEKLGSVKIADDVIACIAALAATEVEGVDSMAGNITNELISKLGVKNLSKGVKLELNEDEVSISLSLNMTYGYNIPEVAPQVQKAVIEEVEKVTGMTVTKVSVLFQDIDDTAPEEGDGEEEEAEIDSIPMN